MEKRQTEQSDEDLARDTRAGSLFAFEELVSRYEQRLYQFARGFSRNGTDAADATQDSFVSAFKNIAAFDVRRSFRAWLFAIARRKCIDRLRSARFCPEDAAPVEPGSEDDPSEILARQEEKARLWDLARRKLPPMQFETLWLRYAEEMNVSEIACVLGLSRPHVKVLLFRARRRMLAELRFPDSARTRRTFLPRIAAPSCVVPLHGGPS